MAGAFSSQLPAPTGRSLVEGQPITRLVQAVDELQKGAVAGLTMNIAGLRLTVRMKDNVLHVSGRVVAQPGTPQDDPDNDYPDDGHLPGVDARDESESGESGVTGSVTVLTGLSLVLSTSGHSLRLNGTATTQTLQFAAGILVGSFANNAQLAETYVDGTDCGSGSGA